MRPLELLGIFYLRILPKSIFLLIYRLGFFEKRRDHNYINPKMSKILVKADNIKVAQEAVGILEQPAQTNRVIGFSSQYFHQDSKHKFRRALIIHPKHWMEQDTFEVMIHSNQILFLQRGLEENLIPTDLLDEEEFDEEGVLSALEGECLLVFWSLSSLNFKSKINRLLLGSEKLSNRSITKLGVISASPTVKLFPRYLEWASVIQTVVFYEEESDYKKQLERFFEVIHLPLIQYTTAPCVVKDVGVRLHFSGTLKYNRLDWLVVMRALCIVLGLHFDCKIVREVNRNGRRDFKYRSEAIISAERQHYSIGINFAQREPGIDAKLIGSFWDYYRNGCIPIVIGENTQEMSSYLTQNVDYFSIKTEQDLRDVILFLIRDTSHLLLLRDGIATRVQDEFNPKRLLGTLLGTLAELRSSD